MSDKQKVRRASGLDEIRANDSSWLTLGDLREMVRQADDAGWDNSCLVSHTAGGSDHPRLRYFRTATVLIIEGGDPS